MVKIESLKELSKSIPLSVNKKVKINKEIIKTITDRKYLWISSNLNEYFENKCYVNILRPTVGKNFINWVFK